MSAASGAWEAKATGEAALLRAHVSSSNQAFTAVLNALSRVENLQEELREAVAELRAEQAELRAAVAALRAGQ